MPVSTGVTSFSGSATGLTPATPRTGAVALAGTLIAGNGGTGITAVGASGNILTSNGSAWTSAVPAVTSSPIFPGVKQGLILSNNVTDATNDIDIAAGKAVDSTGAVAMSLASSMVKQLDANWAAGTNQGGRYSGAAIANTTYHVWLVAKAAGADVDVYLNPSANATTVLTNLQAESGGADYLYVWRIGSILRESAAIVPFDQKSDLFMRKTPVLDVSAASTGTSAVLRALSVPAGLKVQAEFFGYYRNTSGVPDSCLMYFTDPDLTDQAPAITTSPGTSPGGDGTTLDSRIAGINNIYTNTSRQVRSRVGVSGASITLYMVTRGWRDPSIYRS